MPDLTLAIDPGVSGGFALTDSEGRVLFAEPFKGPDNALTYLILTQAMLRDEAQKIRVLIEHVHASPGMPPSHAFTFGANFGWWHGAVQGLLGCPLRLVQPQAWQRQYAELLAAEMPMGLTPDKAYAFRKHFFQRHAQTIWPEQVVTLATADALLLSIYSAKC